MVQVGGEGCGGECGGYFESEALAKDIGGGV